MQNTVSLVNEFTLGPRLNQAVGANRRGEFGLLLALLSVDPRDMAQFHHNPPPMSKDYRAHFELRPEQRLIADLNDEAIVVNNCAAFHQAGTKGFRLQDELTQEALVIRKGEGEEVQAVMDNCDYYTRERARVSQPVSGIKATALIEQLATQRQISQMLYQV